MSCAALVRTSTYYYVGGTIFWAGRLLLFADCMHACETDISPLSSALESSLNHFFKFKIELEKIYGYSFTGTLYIHER